MAMNPPIDDLPREARMDPEWLDDEISLGELFNVLMQRFWLMAGVFVVVLVAGLGYAILATPIYQADALIQVEDQPGAGLNSLGGLSILSQQLGLQQDPTEGEIQILESREVLMKAMAQTQANVEVRVDNRFPLVGNWLARRNEYDLRNGALAPPFLGLDSYAWGGEKLVFAALKLPEHQWESPFYLRVTDGGFEILDDDDTVLAHGVVGQRVDFQVGGDAASLGVKTLDGRPGTRFRFIEHSPVQAFKELRKKLDVAEAGKQSNIITVDYRNRDDELAVALVNAVAHAYLEQNVQRRSAEARQSLKFLEKQLPQLKQNVDEAEDALSKYRQTSGTISVDKETEGMLGQAVKLGNQRLELGMKRDELLQLFTPQHPEVKALNQQIAAVDGAIKKLNKEIDQLPKAQRDLLPYERDARVNTALYISLLNNAQELRVAEAGTVGNVRIIDYAVHNDKPVAPRKLLIAAIAAALGLFLGILAAFLAHFLRPAVQRAEQIEQATGLTTYVTVPASPKQTRLAPRHSHGPAQPVESTLLALKAPEDPAMESLRSLRTGLTFALMGAPGKVVAITGATAGVGKSFVASNFAALLAAGGQRVVLLDCDLRRPRLVDYFGYDRKSPGLSEFLASAAALETIVKPGVAPGLDVIAAGRVPPNPGELLLAPRLGELLAQLSARYDLVVLDTPPILPVADVLAILQHATAAFIVARAEQSTTTELRDALAKLRHSGVEGCVKGLIFNGVRRNRIGYGSSYKYYYSYK